MKSIINSIQSEDFMRVRVGISEPKIKKWTNFNVLGKFSPKKKLINKSIDRWLKT